MRRVLLVLLALALIANLNIARAQDSQSYRNEEMGIAFSYPAEWTLRELTPAQTVTLASKADIEAVAAGKTPDGLLFSITISSFRQVGAQRLDDFTAVLKTIAQTSDLTPSPVRIGSMDGFVADTVDASQNIATRTAILSIGKRRVAVLRGIATVSAWTNGAETRFNDLVDTLNFFPPTVRAAPDALGQVLWQLPADQLKDIVDIAVSGDGAMLYVTDRTQGIWQVNANGRAGAVVKPAGISTFTGIGVLRAGLEYIADPGSSAIWVAGSDTREAAKFIGGQPDVRAGIFAADSPQYFTFGSRGQVYVLDQDQKGTRIHVFDKAGVFMTTWDLPNDPPISNARISSDASGNIYVLGSNTQGIIKLNANGKIISTTLGKEVLENSGASSIDVDRFDSIYVATADQGVLKLDDKGKLMGVIGEGYDESAPPKPGQLGKPIATALAEGGKAIYVLDAGKYPQLVAFALNGDTALNLAAGTRDAGPITYDQTLTGEITEKSFMDVYVLNGTKGDEVAVTMTANSGSNLDPYVDIVAPRNVRLAANDDARSVDLGPKDARLVVRLPATAVYFIRATRFGRETTNTTGTYNLKVTLIKSEGR
jgi:hypothetical protein